MLNLYEFNRSNHEQQVALIWKHGTFLEGRLSGTYIICLYSMGLFFAEIWFRAATNEIELVRGFNNQEMLEPYLNLLNVTDLIS